MLIKELHPVNSFSTFSATFYECKHTATREIKRAIKVNIMLIIQFHLNNAVI